MDHSLFAGGFCTLATIVLVLETALTKDYLLNKNFIGLYSAGCLVWAMLGVVTDQIPLFMIGMIQFFALISSYFMVYKTKE